MDIPVPAATVLQSDGFAGLGKTIAVCASERKAGIQVLAGGAPVGNLP